MHDSDEDKIRTYSQSVDAERITDIADPRYYRGKGLTTSDPSTERLKEGVVKNTVHGTMEFKMVKDKISRKESKKLAKQRFDDRRDAERRYREKTRALSEQSGNRPVESEE